jgi:peptide-methionine (R)-S-oxide reductase
MPEGKIEKTDAEWRKELGPERYEVLRNKGTERAGTGTLLHEKRTGMYVCGGCGAELFSSDAKFDSGSGWPSFTDPVFAAAVTTASDDSYGMRRTEIMCAKCGGHLGHVFDDGPGSSGKRYCVNSLSLDLMPKDKESR